MTPRSAWATLTLVLLCLVPLSGCSATRDLLNSLDKPTARVVDARLVNLNADEVTLDFDIEIKNPYSAPLPVGALDVALSSGGTTFLNAAGEPGDVIPARRSGRVRVPATVNFVSVLTVLEGVRPGSVVPYRADVGLGVDIPGGERLTLPLAHEGQVPIPVSPAITFGGLAWEELSLQRARGTLTLDITNPNQFAATLRSLDYALSLGGSEVARASLAEVTAFEAGGSGRVRIPLSFSTVSLGATAFQALTRGEVSVGLDGDAAMATPFGNVSLPVSASGRTPVSR